MLGGGTLTLGRDAQVGRDLVMGVGNLSYTSSNEATIASGATVRGSVQRQARERRDRQQENRPLDAAVDWLRHLIGLFLAGAGFVLLLPLFSRDAVATLRAQPWLSLGIGTLALIVLPVAAILIFVLGLLVGGWWIALILLALYCIGLVLGYTTAGRWVGAWLWQRLGQAPPHPLLQMLVGIAVLTLIGIVPVIGPLVGLIAALLGLGAFLLALLSNRPPETTEPAVAIAA